MIIQPKAAVVCFSLAATHRTTDESNDFTGIYDLHGSAKMLTEQIMISMPVLGYWRQP